MSEATYSTGQAAKLLSTSSHHISSYQIRRLCETGLTEGELTPGNRWRIPASEVERLKREGLPPIPQPAEDGRPGAIAPAVPDQITRRNPAPEPEAPAVRSEKDGLTIAKTRLERRRVDLEREEVEDSFREREERLTAAELEEQRRKEKQLAAQMHREWSQSWIQFALSSVPAEAPAEYRLEVFRQVDALLKGLDRNQSDDITRRVVEAVVAQALQPYLRAAQIRELVNDALRALPQGPAIPVDAPSLTIRARRAAESAIAKLPATSSREDLREAAAAAIRPLAAEAKHEQAKAQILEGLRFWGWIGSTPQEQEEAKQAVREALEEMPIGSSEVAMKKAKAEALAPFEKKVQRRNEAAKQQETAELTADNSLWRVGDYLRENYEFTSFTDQMNEEARLKKALRPDLIAELLDGLSPDQVPDYIEEWLDENTDSDDTEEEDDMEEEDDD